MENVRHEIVVLLTLCIIFSMYNCSTNTVYHYLFTITYKTSKIYFTSYKFSISKSLCRKEAWLPYIKSEFKAWEKESKWMWHQVGCYTLPCYYTKFLIIPKLSGFKISSTCPTTVCTNISDTVIQLNMYEKRRTNTVIQWVVFDENKAKV